MEADVAKVGLHQSRLDIGHADARVGRVDAQSVGDHLHRRLRAAIDVAVGVGSVASHRTDVDDLATVALHHARHQRAAHVEQALDVGVDHRVPVVEVATLQRVEAQGQSGVVDQHVDLGPVGLQAAADVKHLLLVSHVEAERLRTHAQRLDALGQRLEQVVSAARDDHVVALFGKAQRASLTDAARRAGDHTNLSLFHIFFLSRAGRSAHPAQRLFYSTFACKLHTP